MNHIRKILLVLFFVIPGYVNSVDIDGDFFYPQQKSEYPLKNGRPTTYGVNYYIKTNEERFIREYQELVGDTLYDVYITVDDIRKYTDDPNTLGYCAVGMGSSEIVITNEPRYIQYEYSMLSPYQKRSVVEANNFVKGVVFHELTHNYFNQVILEMKMDSMWVCSEYNNFVMVPRNSFGANFIEEGVAVYVTVKKGECIIGEFFIPTNKDQIQNKDYKYNVLYNYSMVFVRPILDKYGIKNGIKLLLGNNPPSYDEILEPKRYYDRLR
jgi:hypothetical protein